ncbi:MAG: GTPase, family [Rubritepida sp.]|nr:GTPase, family [Rubritepida sp.]
MSARTEFTLLVGFLGSGKTSLLVDWLSLPEAADTAVIVNEAGEIGVDGAILAEGGTVPMAMLANGCVCCSLTSDLVFTIRALFDARAQSGLPPFRRIVLEGSGLSRPGPILRSLAPLAPLNLAVQVVSTCDATRVVRQAAEFDEVAAQLAAAGTIVVTKPDLGDPAEALALARSVNPLARHVVEPDRFARARAAFASAPYDLGIRQDEELPSVSHPRISVLRLAFSDAATWDDRLDAMEDLAAFCGERLLRVKGFLRRPGSDVPLLVQAVGTLFAPPAPIPAAGDAEEGLVVIARDLGLAELQAGLSSAPVRITAFHGNSLLSCTAA